MTPEAKRTGCYPADQFLGFFWGTESESYFPFFNWFIFVATGQWFGDKYQFLQDKKRFHAISLLIGALLCATYIYVSFNVEQNIFKSLTSEIYLGHPSRHINQYYCISWVIIQFIFYFSIFVFRYCNRS